VKGSHRSWVGDGGQIIAFLQKPDSVDARIGPGFFNSPHIGVIGFPYFPERSTTNGDSAGRQANPGEKMIEVKLRFWTNGISGNSAEVSPKHAWASGVVRMETNKTHGIAPKSPKPFHSLLDVGAVIESVLIAHGVVLHRSRKMKKYMTGD
jgi:hypothetical protein